GEMSKRTGDIVVLSHVDDDHAAHLDAEIGAVLSKAFFLLCTEPATHPDQIMQWTRRAKIRSENRLHVVKVATLESPIVSDLLGRVCFAQLGDVKRGGIVDAYTNGDVLCVRGPKHRLLHVPINLLSSLRDKLQEVRRNFEIDPDGSFLYWPDLDVHLGWNQFLQAVEPEELRKAQQRNEGFNQRYGAAVRAVREAAGLSQSKIAGLTDRQVRRIELGESRATGKALAALAASHGLEVNAYMDRIAKALK
ncbi:MAG: helix-turn-helix domain-containing protein, partial [Planctomycetia bacterium]